MMFDSIIFIFIMLPILLILSLLIRNRTLSNFIIFMFSLLFYYVNANQFIFFILLVSLSAYIVGLIIEKSKYKKIIMFSFLSFLILNLAYFKYLNFAISIINRIASLEIGIINIILPLGISFYTFQIYSYIYDVYIGKIKAEKNILNFFLYSTLFTTITSGPIVLYADIQENIVNRTCDLNKITHGLRRFFLGLIKKILISNQLYVIVNLILTNNDGNISMFVAWVGLLTIGLQIYFDFSSYSDMSIGICQALGLNIKENFNYPYVSKTVSEFWRRWHISLGNWFKEYIYFPLGGNRVSTKKLIFNLFVVWFLTGLWHGASFNFILWGMYFFVILVFEKFVLSKMNLNKHFYKGISILLVLFSWVIFQCDSIRDVLLYVKSLINITNPMAFMDLIQYEFILNIHIYLIAVLFAFKQFDFLAFENKHTLITDIVLIVLTFFAIMHLINGSFTPFLYFQF